LTAIYSMTAFARESIDTDQGVLMVEIRAVNHRYLDCSFKLPEALRNLEVRLRQQAAAKLARGKVECLIRVQLQGSRGSAIEINQEQLQRVIEAATKVELALSRAQPINPLELLQFPGVCSVAEADEEILQASAAALFDQALALACSQNRAREGASLAVMIRERLQQVEAETAHHPQALLPELKHQQRARLLARLAELQVEVDNDRLEQVDQGGPCGRRLDFLMQEMNCK
jgi:uncharacterized protein (TIGR00255 family)